jgi:hypothetical protein
MIEMLETPATIGAASVLGAAAIKGLDCLLTYMKTKSHTTNGTAPKRNGVCAQHTDLAIAFTKMASVIDDTKADIGEIKRGVEKISDEMFNRVRIAESDIAVLKDRTHPGRG